MTLTDSVNGPLYPTEWHQLDISDEVDCRQLSDDTFQLRWPGFTQTIDKVGFDLYRQNEDLTPGYSKFDSWCEENHNHPIPVSNNDQS